jgi:hypothetical protein
MNSYTETSFFISNNSTISSRIINPMAGRYYDVHFNLEYDSLVKLLVTSDLPSMDTVFVDLSGVRYTQIPQGFAAVDTNTVKIDSLIQTLLCTASNSRSGQYFFRNVKPYNEYYFAFAVYTQPYFSGKISIDLDSVSLYNNVYVPYGGPPFGRIDAIGDTVPMDSNSILTLYMNRGKGNAVFLSYELFKTETKILILNTVGLNNQKLSQVNVKLFPNPVKEIIFFEGANVTQEEYQIFSVSCKLVKQGIVVGNDIPIEMLDKGVYFISIPEKGISQKFIKN